jgi:hypothetical protein
MYFSRKNVIFLHSVWKENFIEQKNIHILSIVLELTSSMGECASRWTFIIDRIGQKIC